MTDVPDVEKVEADLRELLDMIYKHIADEPPSIEFVCGSRFLDITVIPAEGTIGQLIGKSGCNANSVRSLMISAAGKYGVRVEFTVEG